MIEKTKTTSGDVVAVRCVPGRPRSTPTPASTGGGGKRTTMHKVGSGNQTGAGNGNGNSNNVSPSPQQTSNGVVYVFVKCPHCGVMKHPKGIPAHQRKCKELQEEAKNSHDGKVGCRYCEERFHPSEVVKHLPHCKMRQQKKPKPWEKKATTVSSSTVEEKTTSPKPPTSTGTTTMVASVVETPFVNTLAEYQVVTNTTKNDSATARSHHLQDLPKRTTRRSLLVSSDHKRSVEKVSHNNNNKYDNGDRDNNNIRINNNKNNQACRYCGELFGAGKGLSVHENRWCSKNSNLRYKKRKKIQKTQVPCQYCGDLFGAGYGLSVHETRWCSKNPNRRKRNRIEETNTTSGDLVNGPGRPRSTPRSATTSKPVPRTGTGDVVAVRRGPGRPRSTATSPPPTQGRMAAAAGIVNDMSATTTTATNTNTASGIGKMATSIRFFRRELVEDVAGIGSDHSSPTCSNNHSASYEHSVNLVSSDLQDCQSGDDILQQAMQLAKTYKSYLFTFDDALANQIRNNEKRITYNFHNLDPTSSQFRAMAIHDILTVQGKRDGPGRETVRIEMTITDVIQKTSDMQHGSFIMC